MCPEDYGVVPDPDVILTPDGQWCAVEPQSPHAREVLPELLPPEARLGRVWWVEVRDFPAFLSHLEYKAVSYAFAKDTAA